MSTKRGEKPDTAMVVPPQKPMAVVTSVKVPSPSLRKMRLCVLAGLLLKPATNRSRSASRS